MKIARYRHQNKEGYGVQNDENIVRKNDLIWTMWALFGENIITNLQKPFVKRRQ